MKMSSGAPGYHLSQEPQGWGSGKRTQIAHLNSASPSQESWSRLLPVWKVLTGERQGCLLASPAKEACMDQGPLAAPSFPGAPPSLAQRQREPALHWMCDLGGGGALDSKTHHCLTVLVPWSLYLSLASQLPRPYVTAGQGRDRSDRTPQPGFPPPRAWLSNHGRKISHPGVGLGCKGKAEPTCRGRGCREAESTDYYSRTGYPTLPSLAPLLLSRCSWPLLSCSFFHLCR